MWLGTACASLAVVSIFLWRDRDDERARADALEQRLATLRQTPDAAIGQLRGRMPPLQDATTMTFGGTTNNTPAAQSFVSAEDLPYDLQADRDRERELMRDPAFFAAKRAASQLEHTQRLVEYQRLGLGFPADKAEKLLEYWVNQEMETMMMAESPPIPRTDAERRTFFEYHEKRQREQDVALRAALGEAGYEKYREYMASRPTRNQVMGLSTQLGYGNNALREDQFEPLVLALYAEQAQLDQQLMQYVEREDSRVGVSATELQDAQEHMAGLTETAHQRMHDSAASILSPQQLAVLDAQLKRERDLQRARSNVHRLEMQAEQPQD